MLSAIEAPAEEQTLVNGCEMIDKHAQDGEAGVTTAGLAFLWENAHMKNMIYRIYINTKYSRSKQKTQKMLKMCINLNI